MKKETREEAEEWREQHRSKYPALYNVARLTELPLPMKPTPQCEASDDMVDRLSISVDRISMGDAGTSSTVHDDNDDPLDEIDGTTESAETEAAPAKTESEEAVNTDAVQIQAATNVSVRGGNVAEAEAPYVVISSDDEDDGAYGGADFESKYQSVPIEPKSKPRSVEVPRPISCKFEYDNLSGYIPFVAEVSVKISIDFSHSISHNCVYFS